MSRKEFSKATKREALKRSGGECEAVGFLYGLPPNKRCSASLARGVHFDHVLACSNGGDNSLENCAAVCWVCHYWKTTHHDTPRAAETVRIQDKHRGISKPKSRPMDGTRASGLKKKLNGTVERRA